MLGGFSFCLVGAWWSYFACVLVGGFWFCDLLAFGGVVCFVWGGFVCLVCTVL